MKKLYKTNRKVALSNHLIIDGGEEVTHIGMEEDELTGIYCHVLEYSGNKLLVYPNFFSKYFTFLTNINSQPNKEV